jgi:hypothetical protein
VDGDGDLDALGAGIGDDTLAWFENTAGDGSAWTERTISTATGPSSVFVTDMDWDGDPDVFASFNWPRMIAWFENTAGDGSAWTEHTIAPASWNECYRLFVADLDRDGDFDALSYYHPVGHVVWYDNTSGDGSAWTEHQISTVASSYWAVTAADVDGDGDPDVLSGSYGGSGISWYENAAGDAAVWTEHIISPSSYGLLSIPTADVDGDGDLDILVASYNLDKFIWFENMAGDASAWTERTISATAEGASSVHAADLDMDGDLDIAAASMDDDTIAWFENTAGNGTVWTKHTVSTAADLALSVFVADVDGDGYLDVLSASASDNKIAWYENLTSAAPVPIDVRPGACPNRLNVRSRGILPVAILGGADLDVEHVDAASIRLEGVAPMNSSIQDVAAPFEPYTGKEDCEFDCNDWGPDEWPDLALKYRTQEILSALGELQDDSCVVLSLTGNLKEEYGGEAIEGEDVVLIWNRGGGGRRSVDAALRERRSSLPGEQDDAAPVDFQPRR